MFGWYAMFLSDWRRDVGRNSEQEGERVVERNVPRVP